MEALTTMLTLIGTLGTISSIYFAYIALKNNRYKEQKERGKKEGTVYADLEYIRACVGRVESNLNKIDERCRNLGERLSKLEGIMK